VCGCCKVCAGEQDRWGGGGLFNDLPDEVLQIRRRVSKGKKDKKDKKPAKKLEQSGEEGEEKTMAEGLKLLFGSKFNNISLMCALEDIIYMKMTADFSLCQLSWYIFL